MSVARVGTLAAIMLSSQLTLAEFQQIEDEELSTVTGQRGITIDIEFGNEVGEFMYQDGGSIVMQGMRIGGMDHTAGVGTSYQAGMDDGTYQSLYDPLDPSSLGVGFNINDNPAVGGNVLLNNARLEIDIAGDGSNIDHYVDTGFGLQPIMDNQFSWAWHNLSPSLCIGCFYTAGDGDLIIHATTSDPAVASLHRAIFATDFGIELDKFALKDSTYIAGDDIEDHGGTSNTAQSTTIYSNLKMEGYLGGFDLIIENDGNGFGADGSMRDSNGDGVGDVVGTGDADSIINLNVFFEITEMEYDYDIIGVRYEKIRIHDQRGLGTQRMFMKDQTTTGASTSQGFAQVNTHIYAVKDTVLHVGSASAAGSTNDPNWHDGVAFKSRFQGDMDIGHLSFGDTGISIGEQKWTPSFGQPLK